MSVREDTYQIHGFECKTLNSRIILFFPPMFREGFEENFKIILVPAGV
jgi:hypothetical protein